MDEFLQVVGILTIIVAVLVGIVYLLTEVYPKRSLRQRQLTVQWMIFWVLLAGVVGSGVVYFTRDTSSAKVTVQVPLGTGYGWSASQYQVCTQVSAAGDGATGVQLSAGYVCTVK